MQGAWHGAWMLTLAPIAGLAADVAMQWLSVRLPRGKLAASIIAGALFGLVVTLVLIALALARMPAGGADIADAYSVGVLTYLALAYGFWAFLNLNITSLRIRLLRAVGRAGGRIDMKTLRGDYAPGERLSRRLERLQNAGQIRRQGERWRLNSGLFLTLARCIEGLRFIIIPARYRGD
jgi:hypothetical protein